MNILFASETEDPGVWLPQDIDASGSFTLALGTCDAHYAVRYRNYREASVAVKIK